MAEFLTTPEGRRIAVERTAGAGPAVVFLGGFMSDMTGTKAMFLEGWARARGRGFVRFDYSGHGVSEGRFEDGCIGDWLADARAVLDTVPGPVVAVGSSMGGWISLLLARDMPAKIAGLVTIAAAPDFTDGMWAEFSEAQRAEVTERGVTLRPSDYGAPYPITRRLIEDGRTRRVMDRPLPLPMPVRFLQGSADADVPPKVATRLMAHVDGPDIRLTLVKGADHRFSDPACLDLIARAVEEVGE